MKRGEILCYGMVVDEIVLSDVDTVHVEQMNDNSWWVGINFRGTVERLTFSIHSKRAAVSLTVTENPSVLEIPVRDKEGR